MVSELIKKTLEEFDNTIIKKIKLYWENMLIIYWKCLENSRENKRKIRRAWIKELRVNQNQKILNCP